MPRSEAHCAYLPADQRKAALVEFKIFGKTRLHVDGKDHDLGAAQHRGVLAMLLYEFPRPVHVDVLGQVLWPDSEPDQVKRRLQPIISRLRRTLKNSGSSGSVVKEGNAYRLTLESGDVIDYHCFRTLADAGRAAAGRGDHRTAGLLLREALSLWGGRPLHELEGAWADHCREQVDNFELLPVMHLLLESLHQLGEHLEVRREAGRLLSARSPNEYFAVLYMRSLDALGQYSDALGFYEEFRQRLADYVGAEPGPELRAVFKNILRKQNDVGPVEPGLPAFPSPARNFIGRRDLLAQLDALLEPDDGGRVAVLHGMPSVGKTELALEWANRHLDQFPDGALRLELRGFSAGTPMAADDVLAELLGLLGAVRIPATGDERQAELRALLNRRRMFLLLDDVKTREQVHPLLTAARHCFTIITSRNRLLSLKIREHAKLIRVTPLSTDESMTLLRDEIGKGRSDEDSTALHDLANVVDGLPLGLHIIGQHIANRPGVALAGLVDEFKNQEGLGILGSVHDSDDASVTLPVAFSWSFRDLPQGTARMFRLLGLNPTAEFGVDAAVALLGESESVVSVHLGVLVRSNLLEHGSPRRFRLHDMLHGYAVDLVRHQESPQARRDAMTRLLDWYLASATAAARLLEPQSSPPPPLPGASGSAIVLADDAEALAWLTRERANLVAAVPAAVRHGYHEHAWRLAANFYEAYDRSGVVEDVLVSLRAALKAAAAVGNRHALSGTHSDLGMALYRQRRYAEAQHHFEAGMSIAREAGLEEVYSICAHNLAGIHLAQGGVAKAVSLLQEILRSTRRFGHRDGEALALDQLASAYRKIERDDLALECYNEALVIQREIGHVRGQAATLTELGRLHHEMGENELALRSLSEALEVLPLSGDQARTAEALVITAEVQYDLGRLAEAIARVEQADFLYRVIDAPEQHGHALHLWGHALADLQEFDKAEDRWSRAVALLRDVGGVEVGSIREHLEDLRRTRDIVPLPRPAGLTCTPSFEADGRLT